MEDFLRFPRRGKRFGLINENPSLLLLCPAFFHKLAGPDQARNLDELFLGLAAHELTHTRHYVYAMPQIRRLRLRYKLPETSTTT